MYSPDNFTPWVFLTDLGLISLLLLIGKIIRVKVKLIQKLFIPPSLIAGLLGLLFGPNGLGLLPFSSNIGTYAAVLIALVFGSLPLSSPNVPIKKVAKRVGPMWVYAQVGMLLQWGLAGLFGIFVLKLIWPSLNDAFGVMLSTGFYGGHGTAAAIGDAFAGRGWDEASSLGMTTATVGVVCAIIGGLMMIKWAAKKRYTSFIADFSDLPNELRTGLVPEEKRDELGKATTSSISIESLTFHLALIFLVALGGYFMSIGVKYYYPSLELPVFSCAFVIGLLLKKGCDATNVSNYICPKTTQRLGSTFTDILVACGVASIKLGVVVKYALPLVALIAGGVAIVFCITFFLGRRLSKTYWFERTIFAWGWWTGTMAMGIALIRIVDPKLESKAMDDFALAYLPIAPIEILLITFVPVLFANGFGLYLSLACIIISLLMILLSIKMGWWIKRTAVILISLLATQFAFSQNISPDSSALLWQKAERREPLSEQECRIVADSVHKRYVTLDSHNDTALWVNHPDGNYGVTKGQVTFPLMKEGGLDAAFFAIYLEQAALDDNSRDSVFNYAINEINLFKKYVKSNSKQAELAYTPEDIVKLKAKGKRAVVLALENGYGVGNNLDRIDYFFNLGVRYITLSHNRNNDICDASMSKTGESYGGLSSFGYKAIERMNKLGMIIDLSHASSSTLWDVLEVSKAPVVATHSGAWEIKNHNRNLKDDELRAIASKGGVIQCATGRFFLSTLPKNQVTISHLADHIDHLKKIVGIEHIGLGTDFDGGGGVVGLENCSKMKEVTVELLKRGYTPHELSLFWGGNFLRVWSKILQISKEK